MQRKMSEILCALTISRIDGCSGNKLCQSRESARYDFSKTIVSKVLLLLQKKKTGAQNCGLV